MTIKERSIFPILSLLLLAPVTGEVLSSSLPPMEFFHPLMIFTQMMLYGCGALLLRELKVRRNLGWMAVFLLGLAYGLYEEGVVVRSNFDPTWKDLGILATYGRWAGVNWIWSLSLALFHSVISMMMPLMILDLLFPAFRTKSLLRKGPLIASIVFFILMVPFGATLGMKATFLQLSGCLAVIVLLVIIALKLPPAGNPLRPKGRPGLFYLLGFLGSFQYILVGFVLPSLSLSAPITGLLLVWVGGFYSLLLRRIDRMGEFFNPVCKARLVFGILTLFFAMDVFIGRDKTREDDVRGMMLFGLLYLAFVILINLKVKKIVLKSS